MVTKLEDNNTNSSIIDIDDVNKLSWRELSKILREYGLPPFSRKADMQLRLRMYLKERLQEQQRQRQQQQQGNKLQGHDQDGLLATVTTIKKTEEEEGQVAVTSPAPVAAAAAAAVELTPEQRSRMEQNRKRALQLRQQFKDKNKRLKGASENCGGNMLPSTAATAANLITPVATKAVIKNPYKKNPYAKQARITVAATTPVQQQPTTNQTTPLTQQTPTSLFHPPSPPPPPVFSAWGDCRLDLWETLCQCGGARYHSPDVRMCQCGAALDAGLVCQGVGCGGGGVLLIKSGPRGIFWGCSKYRKKGCKFTKRFGPPYDREARVQLAQLRQRKRDSEKVEEEWSC